MEFHCSNMLHEVWVFQLFQEEVAFGQLIIFHKWRGKAQDVNKIINIVIEIDKPSIQLKGNTSFQIVSSQLGLKTVNSSRFKDMIHKIIFLGFDKHLKISR